MRVHLPERFDLQGFRQLSDTISTAFRRVASTQEAVPYLLLQSTDGSVWRVTADNLGALHTVKVPGGTPT